jgi:hypothetical protein
LLHVLPQHFTLDGRGGFRRPQKSVCSRLEAHVHIVTAAAHEHQALIAAAHLAHLAVEETVYEPLAAAYACVHSEARARGVAVLDMGIQSTDLVIYDGDAMLLAASVPVWGDHLTRDIAAIFKVTYEDAECLKQEYGCALLGLTADSSLIEVPSAEGRPSREARRSELEGHVADIEREGREKILARLNFGLGNWRRGCWLRRTDIERLNVLGNFLFALCFLFVSWFIGGTERVEARQPIFFCPRTLAGLVRLKAGRDRRRCPG